MPTPNSWADLNVYKRPEILVYKSDGTTFIDKWRVVPLPSGWETAINAAIQPLKFTFSFGAKTFDNYDEAGSYTAAGQNLGTVGQGNIVKMYALGPGLAATGKLIYQGVIQAYELQINPQGTETITVTIVPQSSAIATNGLTTTLAFGTPGSTGTYQDPVAIFNYWFNNNSPYWAHPYLYPLTLDGSNPSSSGTTVQYTFQNQDIFSILQTCIYLLPANNWFFRCNPDNSVTLNQTPTTAQNQFIIGRHCRSVQASKDWTQLYNVIEVIGATNLTVTLNGALTNGQTNVTSLTVSPLPVAVLSGQNIILNSTTSSGGTTSQTVVANGNTAAGATSIPVVSFTSNAAYSVGSPVNLVVYATATGSDITTFGPRVHTISDPRIVDLNTAKSIAQGVLALYDQVTYRAQLEVFDYRGDNQPGIGYDIEALQVGQSAQIQDPAGYNQSPTLWDTNMIWDESDWDYSPGAALEQIVQIVKIQYQWDKTVLTLSAFTASQDRALASILRSLQLYTTGF